MANKEACQCLGITQEQLRKMNLEQLTRHYRKIAKSTHPDVGGDEKNFVKIKEAYESLATKKC
jgi:DnaJ-class molecular chaperone